MPSFEPQPFALGFTAGRFGFRAEVENFSIED